MTERIARLPEVKNRTGLSRSVIYTGMAHRTFPQSVKLGARAIGWLESDIMAWLQARKAR